MGGIGVGGWEGVMGDDFTSQRVITQNILLTKGGLSIRTDVKLLFLLSDLLLLSTQSSPTVSNGS